MTWLFLFLGLSISVRLWKWYDSILNAFSMKIRLLDLLTWGLVLYLVLIRYQKSTYFFPDFNLYTWLGLTIIGFLIIGVLRLFIKKNLFHE